MANPFVHIELNATDVGSARDFYAHLFGWTMADQDMGEGMTYTMIQVGDGTGGGIMKHPMDGAPAMWLPYVLVDDIQASTDKARELGAHVIREPMPVSDMGWLSIIQDPQGAVLGMWKASGMPQG